MRLPVVWALVSLEIKDHFHAGLGSTEINEVFFNVVPLPAVGQAFGFLKKFLGLF